MVQRDQHSAPTRRHSTRPKLPRCARRILRRSEAELGFQVCSKALRTALQAKRARWHLKKMWLASSCTPQSAQEPSEGPCLMAMLLEEGRRSRNNCHRNTLIFRGMDAFHSPLTMLSVGPSVNLLYRDWTENFPELVRDHETVSSPGRRAKPCSLARSPSQLARPWVRSGLLKDMAGGWI